MVSTEKDHSQITLMESREIETLLFLCPKISVLTCLLKRMQKELKNNK